MSWVLLLAVHTWLPGQKIIVAGLSLLLGVSTATTALMCGQYAVSHIRGGLAEMSPMLGPCLVFLSAYFIAAFIFALLYGCAYYIEPQHFDVGKHGGDITLLSLFQWSLVSTARVSVFELAPSHWTMRCLNMLQMLVSIVLMSMFWAYFVSYATKRLGLTRT